MNELWKDLEMKKIIANFCYVLYKCHSILKAHKRFLGIPFKELEHGTCISQGHEVSQVCLSFNKTQHSNWLYLNRYSKFFFSIVTKARIVI